MAPEFEKALRALCDASCIYDADKISALDPGEHSDNLNATLAVAPQSADELSEILGLCNTCGVPAVTHGGRTGLCGGAVTCPGELVVLTHRMNAIESIDGESGVIVVGAGVVLSALNAALREHGWTVGIDLAARDSATIGGMVSTNAGGNEAFRNGVMRQRVLGIEAVMADGAVFRDLGKVTKNNDGYDIKQLLIGSEGTLGVVTKVVLKLEPLTRPPKTAMCACESATQAVGLFNRFARGDHGALLSAECMWREHAVTVAHELDLQGLVEFADAQVYVLLELVESSVNADDQFEMALADAAEKGELCDALIAKNDSERADMWRIREDWAAERKYPHGAWFDVSVPLSALDRYVAELHSALYAIDPDFHIFAFGHLGDGNLHLSITTGKPQSKETRAAISLAVFRDVKALGGAIAAEHGIGQEKIDTLPQHCCPIHYALMQSVKRVFDPNNILNRGKYIKVDD
ncbi:MAG: FAD-binding oxidoreductase [Pseudomonadota bacterium]